MIDFSQTERVESALRTILETEIHSVEELEVWLIERSRIFEEIEEALSGHYIDFQCHNHDPLAKQAFEHDQEEIQPLLKKYEALFDEKFAQSPYRDELDPTFYALFIKKKENAISLFREANVALEVEEDRLATQYFEITGNLTVDWHGEEKTLSELIKYRQDADRAVREKATALQYNALLSVKDELQTIMDQLMKIREEKAKNAGLSNYRDYMFKKYERFDYTPEDCKKLGEAIRKYVVPLKEKIQRSHQAEIGVETYRPWDTGAVPAGKKPLEPFQKVSELIDGVSDILGTLDPRFSELIDTMNREGMLDLETRKGKSPGGFCSNLPVTELSFIFNNASNTQDAVTTLLHEMGHCIHNDFKKSLPLYEYKDTPMESSELASMSMELLTLDKWERFYKDEDELKRAKREQLEGIIEFLPNGIIIDLFQHWLYENPNHSAEERNAKYEELSKTYNSNVVDWSGVEEWRKNSWMFVLHIFEVPFYYVEYVIAQLGAVQMYKQYKENPEQALENYKKALALGCSKSLPEVYEAAGIRFDFSGDMIQELMAFLETEIEELKA
ncbi:M3 family oligoendopeptidase [Pullulanibacillus sp. KACC 23026]|uniref:M3 family oligoendopeptidase n=1 Tax=Pullulanibacillus sp. KACC 23026 TaxID=3028315 RepID=UPI0023B1553E|nr:M3 family oligoendopeptidase [Pullulanibacillus sp. KACC 23026]WEG15031.1 M3 family oligoendopeptidase [Pullulanibacillus sp. KACC 23026]